MERRKFLLASGSAVLAGNGIGLLQRPVLGLEFELSATPNRDPSNVDSILIEFTDLKIMPNYLDESTGIDIKAELDIENRKPVEKTVSGLSFNNGEIIDADTIKRRSGEDLSFLSVDELNKSTSLGGDIRILVSHPDISDKSYQKRFTISQTNIIDNFERGDLSPYDSGYTENFSIVSSPVYEGSYALKGTTDSSVGPNKWIVSTGGLQNYPSRGDSIELRMRGTNGNAQPRFMFGLQDSSWDSGYSVNLDISDGKAIFQKQTNNLRAINHSFSSDIWYRYVIDWLSDRIRTTVYKPDGTEIGVMSYTDQAFDSGNIGFRADHKEGPYWDGVRIL